MSNNSSASKLNRASTVRLTTLGMLAAVSLVLVFFNFPLFPAVPFLKFDFADTPILISSILFGPIPSLAVLFVVSVIQAFLLGGDSYLGCIMHLVASGAMVVVAGLICRKGAKNSRSILGLVLGALTMTALMIPMNYLITPLYLGGHSAENISLISSLMLPAIIPFNLIKSFVNCLLSFIVFKALRPLLVKLGLA